uniref:Unspecified product n=1 Tax=Strongyloides venezuelensis TaxID=75913 RepID=A0A0K0FGL2_STRVS
MAPLPKFLKIYPLVEVHKIIKRKMKDDEVDQLTTTPSSNYNYDMNDKAYLRLTLFLIAIILLVVSCIVSKFYMKKRGPSRIRRYETLSAKQLAPELILNSDDEDDEDDDYLFGSNDDVRRQLISTVTST